MTGTPDPRADVLALLQRAPGKRPAFLGEAALDHMFAMIMELASQLWTMRERLCGQEALLAQAGLLDRQAIERWTPTPAEKQALEQMQQAFLNDLFRTVLARQPGDELPGHTDDPAPPA